MRSLRGIFVFLVIVSLAFLDTGAAHGQAIQVSPPSPMIFPGLQPVGSPLPGSLQVIIANPGSQTLVISSATLTGDFSFDSTPPSQSVNNFGSLIAGRSLGFPIMFNSTAAGTRTGTLTLVDNAPGSPHVFQLSGTGFVGAMVQPRNDKLDFATDALGVSDTRIEEIVSVGNQPATVSSVSLSGTGFSQTNNCGATMSQGQSCQITVVFNSSVAGPQSGTLSLANTGATNPVTVPLTGDAADFAFFIDPSLSTATISAGQRAIYPFLVGDVFGGQEFASIAFTCSGLPAGANCSTMATGQNLPAGPFPAEIVISTTPRDSASLRHGLAPWEYAFASVAALALAGRRRRKGPAAMKLFIASFLLAGTLLSTVSCGSSSPNGTPAGTFNLTVTGTRNGLTHSFPVTLTVR